ncbi:hypothetical protein V6N13_082046 [Hibiscus sabdariffa]
MHRPTSGPLFSSGVRCPPQSGTVAISVDGAFIHDQSTGIGVVARDSNGVVLGELAQHSFGLPYSDYAEVIAILAGLQLACDRGWDRIVLETNCAKVAN